jgi:hypothetical protein
MIQFVTPDKIATAGLTTAWSAPMHNLAQSGFDWEFWLELGAVIIGSLIAFFRKKKKP